MCWSHAVSSYGLGGVEADGHEVVCLACALVSAEVAHVAVGGVHGCLGPPEGSADAVLAAGHVPPPNSRKPRRSWDLGGAGRGLLAGLRVPRQPGFHGDALCGGELLAYVHDVEPKLRRELEPLTGAAEVAELPVAFAFLGGCAVLDCE